MGGGTASPELIRIETKHGDRAKAATKRSVRSISTVRRPGQRDHERCRSCSPRRHHQVDLFHEGLLFRQGY
jgi:hypothetical protein